ncbi:GFA family protein [Altererythrobacter aquiaggeris]|uniref:GFA family protein n=1 Tax=Aestuarierythrobacter aquiaggeris TaxID=1898396 RepID=UPI00301590B1
MTDIHKGRCQCGNTALQFSGEPELTFYCHCKDCQLTTGSPFSVELMVPAAGFSAKGHLSTYTVIGDSGRAVHRRSCAKCGSGLFLECDADPGYVFVKPGALDHASVVEPQIHIFVGGRQTGLDMADDLLQ